MDYLEGLMSSSVPPKIGDYLAFMEAACPEAPKNSAAKAWNKIKRQLGEKEDYPGVDHLLDMGALLAAFNNAPEIDESEDPATATTTAVIPPPPSSSPQNMATLRAASSSSRSSKTTASQSHSNGASRNNSGNSSSSGSSSVHPSTDQIIAMRNLFKDNFNQFRGLMVIAIWHSFRRSSVRDDPGHRSRERPSQLRHR